MEGPGWVSWGGVAEGAKNGTGDVLVLQDPAS